MLNVKQRQLNLKTYYYYYKKAIDGIEGAGTKEAYKNFQRDNGLTVDGIYGVQTDGKLILCIKDLQNLLNKVADEDKETIKGIIADELNHAIILGKLQEKYSGIIPTEFLPSLNLKKKAA